MTVKVSEPLVLHFEDDGVIPNNPNFPALVYKGALDLGANPEAEIERLFKANGWGRNIWRDGVYPFPHYHAMIHEALGIARGRGRIQLGGDKGKALELQAGDIAVLPAGTGHQRLIASEDFCVIGAYPPEGTYNLCRGTNPAERDKALQTIPKVPVPKTDPVTGEDAPLPKIWKLRP
jgi:uncharacterized protein YjlB